MLGIIARADSGGLATQTWEMARHTNPDKVLIVHPTDANRGALHTERFTTICDDVQVAYTRRGVGLDPHDLERFLSGLTVVYTAEGDYGAPLALRCAQRAIRLVVHANPELWQERYRDATTTVVTPTDWEAYRVPGSTVMPMPVDRDRCRYRIRTQARTFWHPAAPAFHDRHGSELVAKALRYVTRPLRLIITGWDREPIANTGMARVEYRPARTNYWDLYDECDVLVLPRRYGGLSLPVQEAVSCGLPVVMLNTGPYVGRGGVLSVETTGHQDQSMKGGLFAVWDTAAEFLADEMEELYLHPDMVERCSKAADETAAELDWDYWEPRWRDLLTS